MLRCFNRFKQERKTQNLKRQCHKIFDTFLNKKNSTLAKYEQAKTVSRNFSFREDIRENRRTYGEIVDR